MCVLQCGIANHVAYIISYSALNTARIEDSWAHIVHGCPTAWKALSLCLENINEQRNKENKTYYNITQTCTVNRDFHTLYLTV